MAQYIDKDAVMAEIEELDNFWHLSKSACGQAFVESLLFFLDAIETKEEVTTTDVFIDKAYRKTGWRPSSKQIESLRDMLEYNIGVFDYQKFMEVNSLYDDLTKNM